MAIARERGLIRSSQPQEVVAAEGGVNIALNFAVDVETARGALVTFSGSPDRVPNTLGLARKFDLASKYATITRVGAPLIQTGNFSIVYQFRMLGAPINGGLMLQIPGTSGNNNLMNLYTLNTGVIRCDMHSLAGTATTVDSAAVVVDGGTYTVELVNNNGTLQLYVNGVASGAAAAMPPRDGESTTIRVTNGGADATPNHEVTLVAFRSDSRVIGTNPWQIFQPEEVDRWFGAAAGVSGTIAAVWEAFTSSITGNTTIVGSMAQTAANAVSAFTGSTTVTGTIAKTLGNDVAAFTGNTAITGTIAKTLTNDVGDLQGSAGAGTSGTIAVTTQNNAPNMTGTTSIVGTMNASTENATSNATGSTTILGQMAASVSNFISGMYGSSGVQSLVNRLLTLLGVGS